MQNHKLGRNLLLSGGFLALLSASIPWKNKDIIGQILFGIQSILFFMSAYIQQKEVKKATIDED